MTHRPTEGLRRERLVNGVTLLVQRRTSVPAASIVTHVRAGFLDEPDTTVGISHVLEHMLFKGTPSLAPGELAQRTKALGGSLNAYTSYDRTVYYVSAPARSARELVALQADQVRNPLFDGDELRRELGVIIQEARRKLDTPGAVASETLHELLFDTHRIRRWRIGIDAELERFTREDVAEYHATRYVPARTIVSMVADMDEDEALDMLREQWSDWDRPEVPIPPGPAETGAPQLRARRLEGDVTQAQLVLGWRGVGELEPQVPALDLAAAMLTVGRGSRLAQALREPGLVSSVGAGHYGVIDAGVFAISAELEPARLEEVLGIIAGITRDLGERIPDADELERARTLLRMRIRRRLERFESRATALADAESLGDITRLDREEAELDGVTAEQVREVVEEHLQADHGSLVAYVPRGALPDLAAEAAARLESLKRPELPVAHRSRIGVEMQASALPGRAETPSTPRIPGRFSDSSRAVALATTRATRSDRSGVHHLAHGNLDILTARHGDIGQVSLGVYRMRSEAEHAANAGLAALGLRAMVRGTHSLDATQLALAMESLGGSLVTSLGGDVLGLGTAVLSERAADAAHLLADVMTSPKLAADTIAIERGLLMEDARAIGDDMLRYPFQLALGQAFNDAGYGSPTLGTPDSLATLDETAIRAWHARMLTGGRTTVIAVGDIDPDQLAGQLAEEFSGLAGGAASSQGPAARVPSAGEGRSNQPIHPGQRIVVREKEQSAIAMIFPGPSRADPDRFAGETWAAIAGGLGGRMFESLRSTRSLAYTVIASSWQRRQAGALLTYIAMAPERLTEARDAMLEELEVFRREAPTDEEVSRATALLAGEAETSRQTAAAFAGEIADAWLLGGGLGDLIDPWISYRSVQAGDILAVTSRSFATGSSADGVVETQQNAGNGPQNQG